MAESHVLSGLIAKRNETAGMIEHHKKAIGQLMEDVAHLDATILLFDPDRDLKALRPRKVLKRSRYFSPGEGQRALLTLMREVNEPLTAREIAGLLAQRQQLTLATPGEQFKFEKVVRGTLLRAARSGLLKEEGVGADGKCGLWVLA